jgi:phosphohistidine phosphatase
MEIYILRHGIAAELDSETGGRDADRPLTAKGKRKLRQLVSAIEALELRFDCVLSSPYVRARQTAEIVVDGLDLRDCLELTNTLMPGGSSDKLVRLLSGMTPQPESVLVVGHEPFLSCLISLWVFGDKESLVDLKKGSLCKLETDALVHGQCATLKWLLTPKHMTLISGASDQK